MTKSHSSFIYFSHHVQMPYVIAPFIYSFPGNLDKETVLVLKLLVSVDFRVTSQKTHFTECVCLHLEMQQYYWKSSGIPAYGSSWPCLEQGFCWAVFHHLDLPGISGHFVPYEQVFARACVFISLGSIAVGEIVK